MQSQVVDGAEALGGFGEHGFACHRIRLTDMQRDREWFVFDP
jgi:hypothetical protein